MSHPIVQRPVQAWFAVKASALVFWDARSEQERKLLSLGGAFAALALVWATLIAPAFEGRAQLQKSLPELRQQAAQLQALAAEAATLSGQTPPQVGAMSSASLTSSLTARSLAAQSVGMTGEYAKLELRGVPFGALVQWLAVLQQESRISVEDASIVAQATPGMVDATLTLHQSAGAVK
jgi:general secretion pathway protein M